jgi:flagellar basal-body rod protein FlgC
MIRVIPGADATVSALNAERTKLEIISQNIANAHVTRTAEGGPYQRKEVVFESVMNDAIRSGDGSNQTAMMVKIGRIERDDSRGEMIMDPDHPDADANGYVTMPNVNIQEEMVDMILSSRAYEANLSAIKYARNMAVQTLSIGK